MVGRGRMEGVARRRGRGSRIDIFLEVCGREVSKGDHVCLILHVDVERIL